MADDPVLLSELEDGVLKLALNRPKANAFNRELIEAAQKAFKQAGRDDAVRCVLLTGSGKIFSAGQDVGEFEGDSHVSFRQHLLKTYNPLILQMRRLEKPVLAAVNGAVAGAALGVALACDLRIASEEARFVVGFLGIGLAPDSAVSLMLPQIIGLGRATEAAFGNQPISAHQALEWGLVNRLAPPEALLEQAMDWARQLARGPVRAMGLAKRDFNKSILPGLTEVLDYEAHIQDIAGRGEDHKEGLAAFREKREPDYIN
ncbi:MAG: enoyl-CoA hydratase/isomerase family protein [Anaerolineales bacterium]|nr:enoyl-CoA hydratase/isomerase family protein [Anaerolineales bacterium]